jgi:hypothetical protein
MFRSWQRHPDGRPLQRPSRSTLDLRNKFRVTAVGETSSPEAAARMGWNPGLGFLFKLKALTG